MPRLRKHVILRGRPRWSALILCLAAWTTASSTAGQQVGPSAALTDAEDVEFVSATDSNSPAVWDRMGGRLTLFVLNSFAGQPAVSSGRHLFRLMQVGAISWVGEPVVGAWMEAILTDGTGTWYGFYHHETADPACPGSTKMVPRIGAARSRDFGVSWEDLGPILERSPGGVRCSTRNQYFLGGVGDFSAVLDRDRTHIYLHYTQYLEPTGVGIAVARLPWAARDEPRGSVDIWQAGVWQPAEWVPFEEVDERSAEAGLFLYPAAVPVLTAVSSWDDADRTVDVFWGPSVHWNTHLEQWVMLLNRAKSDGWDQQGVYVSYNAAIDRPGAWSTPVLLVEGGSWYPQVVGLEAGRGTDKEAGELARYFQGGRSTHLIRFTRP